MLLMGRTLSKILMARHTLIFLLQYLGFVINLKKISLALCETNRVSGLSNRYRENDFCSFRGKIKTCVSTMSRDFQAIESLEEDIIMHTLPLPNTFSLV